MEKYDRNFCRATEISVVRQIAVSRVCCTTGFSVARQTALYCLLLYDRIFCRTTNNSVVPPVLRQDFLSHNQQLCRAYFVIRQSFVAAPVILVRQSATLLAHQVTTVSRFYFFQRP